MLIQHYRSNFKQNTQNPTTTSSAYSLFVGTYICLILLGIAMFATELSYINNFSPNHPIVQGRLIGIFVSLGSYTFFSILYIIICSCICKKSKQCNFSSCILLTLLTCVDYFLCFYNHMDTRFLICNTSEFSGISNLCYYTIHSTCYYLYRGNYHFCCFCTTCNILVE